MIRRLNVYLIWFVVLLALGCKSIEHTKATAAVTVLPAHGLEDAEPLMAGLALDEERVQQCKAFEQRWEREMKSPSILVPKQPVVLRSQPENITIEQVDAAVMKYNFNLGDNRTKGCFINALQIGSGGTVTDYATGLMWKQKPSAAMSRSDADEYIRALNAKKTAGYSDWRLPTTEEMASLIDWHRHGARSHVDSYFFRRVRVRYLTADTYKYEGVDRVWIVNSFVRFMEI